MQLYRTIMKLREIIQKEKEWMSPLRWTINYIIIPIWAAISFVPLVVVISLMIVDDVKYMSVFIVGMIWIAIMYIALLIALPFITKKETQIELERYSYLFKEAKEIENIPLVIVDESLTYTLDKDGARMEVPPEEGEQVFDEAKENVFYIPWERAEIAFATQTYLRRVHIALAVFPMDENAPPFFIPFNEDVYAFIKKIGLDKQFGADWAYLFYNPEDAFKQILTKGRILKMRNKKTGEVFVDAQGNFIGDKE